MNYAKIYDNLCQSRKLMDRKKGKDTYYENHHIIPRCFGGPNTKENLVLFTFREHWIAHLLLTQMYDGKEKGKMAKAFWKMSICKNDSTRLLSSHQYEFAKNLYSENCSGENAPMYGKRHSAETKLRMSKNNGSVKGVHHSEETKQKISKSVKGKNIGKKHNDETKSRLKKAWEKRKLIPVSEETKQKLSDACIGEKNGMFGRAHSPEAIQKMSEARKLYYKKLREEKDNGTS